MKNANLPSSMKWHGFLGASAKILIYFTYETLLPASSYDVYIPYCSFTRKFFDFEISQLNRAKNYL